MISLINKTIRSGKIESKSCKLKTTFKTNNRSPNLSQRKSQKIFCALKIPRGFFWELNINKTKLSEKVLSK